jgi:hypothetical protein
LDVILALEQISQKLHFDLLRLFFILLSLLLRQFHSLGQFILNYISFLFVIGLIIERSYAELKLRSRSYFGRKDFANEWK